MSWLTDLFSSGVNAVIGSVGDIIDSLDTSDEEKLEAKLKLQKEMNRFKEVQIGSIATYDEEITERHKTDMQSDSWLSKNIRPLLLIFLTAATTILGYLTIFTLSTEDLPILEPWISLFKTLLITAFMFYFGSRGYEKIQKIKSNKKKGEPDAD